MHDIFHENLVDQFPKNPRCTSGGGAVEQLRDRLDRLSDAASGGSGGRRCWGAEKMGDPQVTMGFKY